MTAMAQTGNCVLGGDLVPFKFPPPLVCEGALAAGADLFVEGVDAVEEVVVEGVVEGGVTGPVVVVVVGVPATDVDGVPAGPVVVNVDGDIEFAGALDKGGKEGFVELSVGVAEEMIEPGVVIGGVFKGAEVDEGVFVADVTVVAGGAALPIALGVMGGGSTL